MSESDYIKMGNGSFLKAHALSFKSKADYIKSHSFVWPHLPEGQRDAMLGQVYDLATATRKKKQSKDESQPVID